MKSISLGYKLEKVRLVLELKDSPDLVIQNAKVKVRTGRTWDASQAVQQATTRLKHQEVVGMVRHGKAGLGWGASAKMWSKATEAERKRMLVLEVVKEEEEGYRDGQHGRG